MLLISSQDRNFSRSFGQLKRLLKMVAVFNFNPKLYNYNSKGQFILLFRLGNQPKPLYTTKSDS